MCKSSRSEPWHTMRGGQLHAPTAFHPSTHLTVWVGPTAELDYLGKTKTLAPAVPLSSGQQIGHYTS